jgi:hypothetical protein
MPGEGAPGDGGGRLIIRPATSPAQRAAKQKSDSAGRGFHRPVFVGWTQSAGSFLQREAPHFGLLRIPPSDAKADAWRPPTPHHSGLDPE